MVSRKDRNDSASLIAAFLNGKLAKSHTQVWHRVYDSDDATVKHACEILADYHEGYENDIHLIDKTEWDHLERVRLVLMSDAELQRSSKCIFDLRRFFACIGLGALLVFAVLTGTGWHLLVGTSALGLIILCFWKLFPATKTNTDPYKHVIEPFVSFRQLETVYKSTSSFRKYRFPKKWQDDADIWNSLKWLINSFWITVCGIVLLTLSPIILLVLAIPDCEPEFTVMAK